MEYNPITVTDLNLYLKSKIDKDDFLNNVIVKGEISNFKNHYTGHMYFTLKDENSLVKCIMFKSYATNLKFIPKDGMKVIILGTVSVYERDGVFQIYSKGMQQDGIGSLHLAYEELKNKLEKEGLFSKENKKQIPNFPKCIGVLTSNTGSVIRDIINVATRRNPNVYIQLLPVPVQGAGAADKIAEAINIMNKKKMVDVIILARGGGSLEDLWTFNEEILARAIYNSELPIISAVGHETDFTIADFVADLRAPTPSAAAELSVPNISQIIIKLEDYENRLKVNLLRKIELMRLRYEKCMEKKVFKDPLQKLNEKYIIIDTYLREINNKVNYKIKLSRSQLAEIISKVDALSPLKTLLRGYSITTKEGNLVKSVCELKKNDEIQIRFVDGCSKAKIV